MLQGILRALGVTSPMNAEAREFNLAAERYYRTSLRAKHIEEAFAFLEEDFQTLSARLTAGESDYAAAIRFALSHQSPARFLASVKHGVVHETIPLDDLVKLIDLVLANTPWNINHLERRVERRKADDRDPAPICGPGLGRDLYGTPVLG